MEKKFFGTTFEPGGGGTIPRDTAVQRGLSHYFHPVDTRLDTVRR